MNINAFAGSFHFGMQLPERVENKERDRGEEKELSEDEEEKRSKKAGISVKKKRKRNVCDEEEQAGPSCMPSPSLRKKKKIIFCKSDVSLLKICIMLLNIQYITEKCTPYSV